MVRTRSVVMWLFLGGVILACAFAFSSYYAVSHLMSRAEDEEEFYPRFGGNLAVVEIKGVIFEARDVLKQIEELEQRKSVKAVVVRINSPGGAVGSSQEIFDAVKRLRKVKTVFCSLGDVAASGGYYVAAACEKIVSNPGTLTGSIGVIMQFINLRDLYTWAKVDPFVIKAGHFKDIGSDMRKMSDEERALMQKMVDQVHAQFKEAVKSSRKLDAKIVDSYADGRILNGEEAKELGFVDILGDEHLAIQLAATAAGIQGEPDVLRPYEKRARWGAIFDSDARAPSPSPSALLRSMLPFMDMKLAPGIPYYLPPQFLSGAVFSK